MIALETEQSSRESVETRYQQQVAGWEVRRPSSGRPTDHSPTRPLVVTLLLHSSSPTPVCALVCAPPIVSYL